MTKKLKVWACNCGLALVAIVVMCSGLVLAPACRSVRAQDAATQSLTDEEALTISLLQAILAQLVELNHNVEHLPAAEGAVNRWPKPGGCLPEVL